MKSPLPSNEPERLAALRNYAVLDTPPEQAFDDLTAIAAEICGAPSAVVSFVDSDRQWFKSRIGVAAEQTPRDISFCTHTILHADEVLEVADARVDPRFAASPLVTGEAGICFYAGAPLVTTHGHALGAICVMDRQPRALTETQRAALQALSRQVVAQLDLRRHVRELAARQQESARLLAIAEKSRRALLSVLEDQQRDAATLRESETRFRQLAENIEEVFWMTDPTKSEILYVSPAYEKIWGRSAQSLYAAPSTWLDAIHPQDRGRVAEAAFTKQIRGDYNETYRIVRPDGQERWIRDRGFPIRDDGGRVLRVVGTAEDVTERHVLENQVRQAQKLEAIGTLAGGIAHDFNNILTAIGGHATLAGYAVNGNAEAMESLDAISAAAKRAGNLVQQILSFSRPGEQERRPVQLRHAVNESVQLLRASIPSTIDIVSDIGRNLPLVLADTTQVHQIVMNLGTNGWHAMRGKPGRLEIRLSEVRVSDPQAAREMSVPSGRYVRLLVSDTGCGMDRSTQERIFEPFFTTKAPGEGTGLGLAVVHGIVRNHDAAIQVQSEPGRGSTFQILFPVHEAEESVPEQPAEVVPRGRGERVLLIDDEEVIARLGQRTLANLGYTAEARTNPVAALEEITLRPDRYDVVVTDQTMPRLTGVELAERILRIRPGLPVLLTTGFTGSLTREDIKARGLAGLFFKPFTLQSLGQAVHQALHPGSNSPCPTS